MRYLSAVLRIACMALTFGIEYGLYVPIKRLDIPFLLIGRHLQQQP